MPNKSPYHLRLDKKGRLTLPKDLSLKLGAMNGGEIEVECKDNQLRLRAPVSHLARIYLEPTNTCNLSCLTCMRNVWDEPPGFMDEEVFQKVLSGLSEFKPSPAVFFGGFGEPLAHPQIIPMIREVKNLGVEVEMITNGTALTEDISTQLVDTGLDRIWFSIDGARPESYMDIRLGASLPYILDQIKKLRLISQRNNKPDPEIGIAFVAMQRNIKELPDLLRLSVELGASRFSISNVLAHTPELRDEILYQRSIFDGVFQTSCYRLQVDLPRMDVNDLTKNSLAETLRGCYRFSLGGGGLGGTINRCPFIQKNSVSIRWDGAVSPCLPLLHTYVSYLEDRPRKSSAFSVGSLLENSLKEIWLNQDYIQLRQRLWDFDFSPCVFCNSCEMAGENREDCFGNSLPACGGCLWAQGLIQCP